MIAIKDLDMPVGCCEYHKGMNNLKYCPLYSACEHRHTVRTNCRPDDCPLIEINVTAKED